MYGQNKDVSPEGGFGKFVFWSTISPGFVIMRRFVIHVLSTNLIFSQP